jgi:hypothetical protein
MMHFHKKILGLFFSFFAVVAHAQSEPINVIVSLPPGGLTDKVNLAMKDGLEKAGYKTNLVRFDNCKGLENWMKDNPGKPAVFEWNLGNSALAVVDPQNPGACGSVPLTKDTVLAINFQSQFQACSLRPVRDAIDLWKTGKAKLGITAAPAINGPIAEKIVADVNKNIEVIKYKGNPALIQAMISREIDFVGQFSNASSVIAAGGTCFFTTAGVGKAAKNSQISLDDFRKNSPMSGIGYMSVTVGLNVDPSKVRPVVTQVIKNNGDLSKVFAAGADIKGIATGQTPEQQFQTVESYISYFRK